MTPPPEITDEQRIASLEAEIVTSLGLLELCRKQSIYSVADPHSELQRRLGAIQHITTKAASTEYADKVVVDREEWEALESCIRVAREAVVYAYLPIVSDRLAHLDSLRKTGGGE